MHNSRRQPDDWSGQDWRAMVRSRSVTKKIQLKRRPVRDDKACKRQRLMRHQTTALHACQQIARCPAHHPLLQSAVAAGTSNHQRGAQIGNDGADLIGIVWIEKRDSDACADLVACQPGSDIVPARAGFTLVFGVRNFDLLRVMRALQHRQRVSDCPTGFARYKFDDRLKLANLPPAGVVCRNRKNAHELFMGFAQQAFGGLVFGCVHVTISKAIDVHAL